METVNADKLKVTTAWTRDKTFTVYDMTYMVLRDDGIIFMFTFDEEILRLSDGQICTFDDNEKIEIYKKFKNCKTLAVCAFGNELMIGLKHKFSKQKSSTTIMLMREMSYGVSTIAKLTFSGLGECRRCIQNLKFGVWDLFIKKGDFPLFWHFS